MLKLPKHPVPMKSTFRNCFLVNYLVDPKAMARVLPAPLEADVFDGRAYLCIVIAELYCMRPAFVPWPFGISYNQVLYRALVHCQGGERRSLPPQRRRQQIYVRHRQPDDKLPVQLRPYLLHSN